MISPRLRAAVIASSGASSTPGALPAFSAASTAVSSGTLLGTHAVNYPPTIAAGDLLMAACAGTNTNNNANIVAHADLLAAGFTVISDYNNSNSNVAIVVAWKLAVGNEDGTSITNAFTGTGGATADGIRSQMFRFTAANGFHTDPIIDEHLHTNADNFNTSIDMPTVTPSGTNQLGVCVIGSSGNATLAAATGESGGDWTLAHSAAANSCGLHLQVADLSAGTAISGGTGTFSASSIGLAVGFALKPAET